MPDEGNPLERQKVKRSAAESGAQGEARRMLAAVVAYLQILCTEWDECPSSERFEAVRLALEAARRAERLLDAHETGG